MDHFIDLEIIKPGEVEFVEPDVGRFIDTWLFDVQHRLELALEDAKYDLRDGNETEQESAAEKAAAILDLLSPAPKRKRGRPPTDTVQNGMRRSEQYDCEWAWVDLDAQKLTVPRSKHGQKRYVFLNDAAVAAFRLLWQFSSGEGKAFGHLYRTDSTKGAREWFEKALDAVGIADFRWHDLRHTFASRLVAAGVDIYMVKELMGHRTIQMTVRYAHLAPQRQLEAVQRLCNTGIAQSGATDTKTSTSGLEQVQPITASLQ